SHRGPARIVGALAARVPVAASDDDRAAALRGGRRGAVARLRCDAARLGLRHRVGRVAAQGMNATTSEPLAAREAAPTPHLLETVERAASAVRARFSQRPDVGITLGTVLGRLGAEIEVVATIDYGDIPGFPLSTVESHEGRLLCGRL